LNLDWLVHRLDGGVAIPVSHVFLVPLLLGLVVYPPFIRLMQRLSWGQEIRPEGPEDHLSKKGTPTMGGAVLLATFLSVFWFTGGSPRPDLLETLSLLVFTAVVLAHAGLGFVDDWTKIARKRSLGLKARHKLAAQLAIGLLLGLFSVTQQPEAGVWLPFLGWVHAPLIRIALAIVVVVGASNAVNLTDGLDGLAGGTTAIAFLAYVPICVASHQPALALGSVAMVGACVGFLWYNAFPARVFMGDTGSLALGAGLGTLAVLTHTEFLLVLMGGVFVLETVSVILQVGYFKISGGKRIFRMAPIHHHFCKGGLHEVQVTTRMWAAAIVLAVLSLSMYAPP
jgi:phospho-N-acetylmuramoyl-pentapeptide-transferase